MKKTLENLWDGLIALDYATLDTEEEKALAEKSLQLEKLAYDGLTNEQIQAVEAFVDAVCEIESAFAKKAFAKGCAFTLSFLLEAGAF